MLVSHQHRFIFLKSVKTAGTSVEIFFERFCLPPDVPSVEYREEVVTPHGIVGARPRREDSTWWNHMAASQVKAKLGDVVWRQYFRFSCVRNPFDAVVSMFWWTCRSEPNKFDGRPFADVREAFQQWLSNAALPTNTSILFQTDGSLAVDDVVKYESLVDDVARICERLGVEYLSSQFGAFKTGIRKSSWPSSDYYDVKSARIVSQKFEHYRGHFSYDLDWRP